MNKRKIWFIATIAIVLLFVGGYGFAIYRTINKTVESIHEPMQREKSEKRQEKVTLDKKEPFSVLLLGVDERAGDKGRSDTIIVMTINPNLDSIKMLSIPRDTRTEIIGLHKLDKINHAYAFGDIKMAIATVEDFLDIPIDYYVKINMEGFKEMVDAVGGVTVNNSMKFVQDGHTFDKGTIKLTGEAALSYVQMRKEDPKGDFGRQERQQQIIKSIFKKGASITSLTKYEAIFDAIGDNVKTNLKLSELITIQKDYNDVIQNVEQLQLHGKGQIIDGIYYLIISEQEKQRVEKILKAHLRGSVPHTFKAVK
ncbi:MAG TPA: LytR family transcriptional regulator [Bacillus bacterium]|nr:LytR family transcriptional regulator [Bacillus sp. (in: firmicutes)]